MLIEASEKNFYSDTEITEIINYLSYELILENLRNQINELSGYGKVNYIEIFDDKYNYILKNHSDNQEVIDKVTNIRSEFYMTILEEIQDKFGFRLIFNDILLREELYKVIGAMYNFFILNLIDNLKNYFLNYIKIESKNIIRTFKNQINMKDLYFSLLKKKLNKENSILVFSVPKVPDIIEFAFIEDFIDLVIKEDKDEYNYYIIDKLFNSEELATDVTCNMDIFKGLIKSIIKSETMVIHQARAELYQNLLERKED